MNRRTDFSTRLWNVGNTHPILFISMLQKDFSFLYPFSLSLLLLNCENGAIIMIWIGFINHVLVLFVSRKLDGAKQITTFSNAFYFWNNHISSANFSVLCSSYSQFIWFTSITSSHCIIGQRMRTTKRRGKTQIEPI